MKVNDQTTKSFLDHVEDLRWMLIRGFAALAIGMTISLALTKPFLEILYHPLRLAGQNPGEMLRVLGVADALSIQISLALSGGVLIALPFILYFLASFLLPALTPREARALIPAFVAGALLFVGGAFFCYELILPQTLKFFYEFDAWLGFRTEWTVQSYIDFVTQMLLAFGLSFELPLVLLVLNILGIVRRATLARYRRHTAFILFILACCVVPSTDPFSLLMMAGPMYLLFEGTLVIMWFVERRRGDLQGQAGDESDWQTG
ncbi:Sec-independent protein translocase TatC [Verrucomicrobium sp. GAS474]|uniref:twin-arginine translocase subunit TatC n=1 Tax=Verrucomicrobium sp. GAS474 TaxID=1882831 RepID=UPI00087C3F0B|nr:twin-arginine translocase subunit TatC [Verrucomicrobium sp. GAS474]SDT98279.1 Sec-independent protein translocase TatC [Verrucomicrobium sp. GAS474]